MTFNILLTKANSWVIKTQCIATFLLVAIGFQVGLWAIDRQAPITNISAYSQNVTAGTTTKIIFNVERKRYCDASVKRWVQDSEGARYYLQAVDLTGEQIYALEQTTPGKAILIIDVPDNAAIGRAHYVADIEFYCNPVHKYWPLKTTVSAPFDIIAKKFYGPIDRIG